jgi:hypothetical protein
MKTRRLLAVVLTALPVLAVTAYAAGSDGNADVRAARAATTAYHDAAAAQAAGWSFRLPELSGETCIVQPGEGAMGVHLVNTGLLDATLDPAAPEALVYEPGRGEKLKLVALEYVVFEQAWRDAGHTSPPTLFGRTFDFTPAPNRYGLPAFYALHAWLWRGNPSGQFNAWNPKIDC